MKQTHYRNDHIEWHLVYVDACGESYDVSFILISSEIDRHSMIESHYLIMIASMWNIINASGKYVVPINRYDSIEVYN